MNFPVIEELTIINSILDKLKAQEFSIKFEAINYWQAQPTEFKQNYLFFRDNEGIFRLENNIHKVILPVEITMVLFSENPAILGTQILQELIQFIGKNRNWGLNNVTTDLSKREKLCDTQGAKSCMVILEVLVSYKSSSFYLSN